LANRAENQNTLFSHTADTDKSVPTVMQDSLCPFNITDLMN